MQMAMFSTDSPGLGQVVQRDTSSQPGRLRWTQTIPWRDMSQGLWQEEPEAWKQTLKGSQDAVLGPWLTFLIRAEIGN